MVSKRIDEVYLAAGKVGGIYAELVGGISNNAINT
jgi:hypothetical protein